MSFVPASFVVFLVAEKSTKAKHLQFVSGCDPVTYWLANYIWDMVGWRRDCVGFGVYSQTRTVLRAKLVYTQISFVFSSLVELPGSSNVLCPNSVCVWPSCVHVTYKFPSSALSLPPLWVSSFCLKSQSDVERQQIKTKIVSFIQVLKCHIKCHNSLSLSSWSITPIMYPASFWFEVPSTAYVFLIVINLFIGITATVATFLLQLFEHDKVGQTENCLSLMAWHVYKLCVYSVWQHSFELMLYRINYLLFYLSLYVSHFPPP